ncbi:MAG TPA: tyrosine--tRNA ligase [Candidatus Acidoferrum sp.]|nr:tyrosine--tRNA ligase [Candidatus Acidoferrum sp.]
MTQSTFKHVAEQLAYLKKGVAEIIREDELKARLENSFKTGVPLRVYLGVDPTAPDIHLGHTVVLRKLKHFQDMGHTAIFLIGDFSAIIGDPTGRSETRPPLSREEVNANAKTYLEQVFKILDKDKTEVRYNSEWLDRLSSYDIVRLCGHYRLARMLEREDFRSRLDNEQPISVHELLYPLLTAYDAVMLKSDVELGATEQKFNLLVHREIQREYGLEGEVCLTMPILVGLDGSRKMSKSLGNYVGITESPADIFGKLMSIPDDLMWSYLELLTDRGADVIENMQRNVRTGATHPKQVKISLASEIVRDFWGQDAALKAAAAWEARFSRKEVPEGIAEKTLSQDNYVGSEPGKIKLSRAMVSLDAAASRSKAEQLIKDRAVELDGVLITDPTFEIDLVTPKKYLLRVGKKQLFYLVVR